jgi:PII-like signaling protein
MLLPGPAKKVTIYMNEDAKYRHGSLYEAVLEFLRHHHVAGATALRAIRHLLDGHGAARSESEDLYGCVRNVHGYRRLHRRRPARNPWRGGRRVH